MIDEEIGCGEEGYGLYKFQKEKKEENKLFVGSAKSSLEKIKLNVMHARLGHSSLSKMEHLEFCYCKGIKEFFCDTCHIAKHHKLPFHLSKTNATHAFYLIHVDLWGPYRIKNITGARYFLTIVDDYSRVTWTHLLKSKEKVRDILSDFLAHVETQFNKVKEMRSDNGTEVVQEECGEMLRGRGIVQQRSIPGNPQQNGRVERKHIYLLETARSLRLHAGLPKYLWGERILSATHLINLLPSSVLVWLTPYENLSERKPNYEHLSKSHRVFMLWYKEQQEGR